MKNYIILAIIILSLIGLIFASGCMDLSVSKSMGREYNYNYSKPLTYQEKYESYNTQPTKSKDSSDILSNYNEMVICEYMDKHNLTTYYDYPYWCNKRIECSCRRL